MTLNPYESPKAEGDNPKVKSFGAVFKPTMAKGMLLTGSSVLIGLLKLDVPPAITLALIAGGFIVSLSSLIYDKIRASSRPHQGSKEASWFKAPSHRDRKWDYD